MASIIRIKRSATAGNPTTLAAGELAYSSYSGSGGNRLYVGMGSETDGNAANHHVIGGTYYTGLIDASTAGSLTTNASSIPVLSSTGTIDKWYVGNVYTTGNTIATTNTNGNLVLNPNGTGKVSIADTWTLPRSGGSDGYVLTSNGAGTASWSPLASSSFTLAANTGTSDTFNTGETLTFTGTAPIATAVSNNTITISATDATTSAKGVASFNSSFFSVASGAVSIKANAITSTELQYSSITVNGSTISLGGSATITASLTNSITFNSSGGAAAGTAFDGSAAKTIDYSTVGAAPAAGSSSITTLGTITTGTWNGTTIAVANGGTGTTTGSITGTSALTFTAGGSNTNVNLVPQGTGTVDVSSKRITSVADPTQAQDAATKAYVDAMQTGLDVKASVRVATTANITLSNTQTIDGVALSVGDRVLVKNQSTGSQNGIYVVASSSWSRASDCDNSPGTEVTSGMFTFVEEGTANGDSGWVLTTDGTITLGTTALTFTQFSGAGQVVAGSGLSKTGNTLDVNVANGIEIVSDNVQLASSAAGAGLSYTSGVLAVGAGTGITVNADDIQISASYAGQSSITTLGTVTTGTWNGTAIANAYLANSSITVNGSAISLGGSATVTANTTNSVTFAATGGAAAGATFNGSAAKTVDYSTVGAAPSAGSSSITTVGTISSGTWNGTAVASGYGGTGFSSYTKGDMIYASATNTLSKLSAGTDGQVLQMNSSGVMVWGDLDGGTY